MVDRVTRFGVSLPSRLLERFDGLIEKEGYTNRSKAISDAVIEFITNHRWKSKEGSFIGSISYAYDHHMGDVTQTLTEIQHRHGDVIKSTMHSHVTHDTCVEVLIVSGDQKKIRRLYNGLNTTRGVENCKLSVLLGLGDLFES